LPNNGNTLLSAIVEKLLLATKIARQNNFLVEIDQGESDAISA